MVYIVGKVKPGNAKEWTFQGVFMCEETALAACHNDLHFIAPVEMDKDLGPDDTDWPGLYYPHRQEKPCPTS